jgi:hypothetical protein
MSFIRKTFVGAAIALLAFAGTHALSAQGESAKSGMGMQHGPGSMMQGDPNHMMGMMSMMSQMSQMMDTCNKMMQGVQQPKIKESPPKQKG